MRLLDQQIDSLCRQYGHADVRKALDAHADMILDNWRTYELKHALDEIEERHPHFDDTVPF